MNSTTVDQESLTITFERRLRATREEVFDAWTRPDEIAEWWDPTGTPLVNCEIDLRVGGAFRFENSGHSQPFSGIYRVIERPAKLVFDALGSVGTVALTADGETTRMKVEIRCSSADHLAQFLKLGIKTGTERTLDNLVARFDEQA
jgi:uncharacterized protein YndB with AHSA1/START domain